jgi:hypothetical protein
MTTASLLPTALLGVALTVLASGCASDDGQPLTNDVARPQRAEATTGSHIPNKTALPPQSDVEREKTVERVKELQKTSQPVQTKPS